MSFQAVRAVFEQPIIDAMAALDDPVPVYMANQQFPYGETAEEYGTRKGITKQKISGWRKSIKNKENR